MNQRNRALRMLGQNFVKDGPLDRGATQLFAKLMKYREEADYNPTFDFAAREKAELAVTRAGVLPGVSKGCPNSTASVSSHERRNFG